MQLKHGLVWVWPQRGADAFLRASQKPPAKLPEEQMDFSADNAMYSVNPVSWALMLENSMDPSHAASLHEGPGLGTRKEMVLLPPDFSYCYNCPQGGGWVFGGGGGGGSQRLSEWFLSTQMPALFRSRFFFGCLHFSSS